MSTYTVTSYSYTKGCETYFKSLPKSGAIPIIIEYEKKPGTEGDPQFTYPENALIFKVKKQYPGNTGRFMPLLDILANPRFTDEDWFVFTDTQDIKFQDKIPNLSHIGQHILVASEGKKFGDVQFWVDRVEPGLLEMDMYNVGCFAMRKAKFVEFLTRLKRAWTTMREWYNTPDPSFPFGVNVVKTFIGSVFNSYTDTIIFNKFIFEELTLELPGLFGCICFNEELGYIKKRRGIYYMNGKKLSITHHNGDSKPYN